MDAADRPLQDITDNLLSLDPMTLPDEAVRQRVKALHRLVAAAQAATVAAVGALDRRTIWTGDAAPSAAAWLVARVDVMPGQARRDVQTARTLRDTPVVEAAFASGELGRVKVDMLLTVRLPEVEEVFAQHEVWLVETVAGLPAPQAKRFLQAWLQRARLQVGSMDPEAPADADPAPRAALDLSQTFDGRWVLDGEMDVEAGSVMRTVIDAEVDAMDRAGIFGPDDGLTPRERRGLAHQQVLRRNGRAGIKNGELRPSIAVRADIKTLLQVPVTDEADALSRICETRDGTPIPLATLARLACEATAYVVMTDRHGHVLDVGRSLRFANRRQKRALIFEHRGCQFPGCSAPAEWCDAHHIVPVTLGGPTDMANLCLLCEFHHVAVHAGGFRRARAPNGDIDVGRPDGTPVDRCRPNRPPSALPGNPPVGHPGLAA